MIIEQCPHCLVKHVQTTHRFSENLDTQNTEIFWQVVRCQNNFCNGLVLLQKTADNNIQKVFPFVENSLNGSSQIPQAIRNDFDEASTCLGAGCHKASLVMSRRVLQRCLKDQGCNDRNLVDAIKNAVEKNILRKAFHPLANEIRQYGNLGAHPDDDQLQNANAESASQVLEFAKLLIHEFYEVPASAEGLRKNRTDQKENR